jgi:hypothetical protein
MRFGAAAFLLSAALLAAPGAARSEVWAQLNGRPGVIQPILYLAQATPWASVILFSGGDGSLAQMDTSFLMRERGRFNAPGLSVAVPDTPSDHPGGFGPLFRTWTEHVQDLYAVVAFLQRQSPAPIWAIGTSNGTISAANVAARLGPGAIAGVVLTSSVWLGGLGDVPIDKIGVPILVIHNRNDACPASPFAFAAASLPRFVDSPMKEFIAVDGPVVKSEPCGARSPHDFYGVDDKVVALMIAWIKKASGATVSTLR